MTHPRLSLAEDNQGMKTTHQKPKAIGEPTAFFVAIQKKRKCLPYVSGFRTYNKYQRKQGVKKRKEKMEIKKLL